MDHALTHQQLNSQAAQMSTIISQLEMMMPVLRRPLQQDTPLARTSQELTIRRDSGYNPLERFDCHCPKKGLWKNRFINGYLGLYGTKTAKHLPSCPLYIASNVVTTIGVKFRLGLFTAAYLFETRIEYGSSHVTPHIRYHNVVDPQRSPAFQAVYTLERYIQTGRLTTELFEQALALTIQTLSRVFQQRRAGIDDVDQYGSSIFNVSFQETR